MLSNRSVFKDKVILFLFGSLSLFVSLPRHSSGELQTIRATKHSFPGDILFCCSPTSVLHLLSHFSTRLITELRSSPLILSDVNGERRNSRSNGQRVQNRFDENNYCRCQSTKSYTFPKKRAQC